MPLISVITPVYNNKKYLRNCVNSIINQDFSDYEHILVDDGSTDGTSELCDEIAKENENVHVIHQDNQWIYASFNNGVAKAKGEYVFILNSDDVLEPGTFNSFYEIIKDYHPDVIWSQVKGFTYDEANNVVTEDGISGLAGRIYEHDVYLENKEMIHNYWKDLYYYGFTINQANLYKREIMVKHPFRNDVFGADSLFNISIANDLNNAYILARPIYRFYTYNNSKMNASVGKLYGYEFEMYREILNGHSELISMWNGSDEDLHFFKNLELNTGINCFKLLNHPNDNHTVEEKIDIILSKYFTPDFLKETEIVDSFGIIDPVITKELLVRTFTDEIGPDSKFFFIKRFFEEVRKPNKNEIDINIINNMLYNELNPCHYGESLCVKMGLKN